MAAPAVARTRRRDIIEWAFDFEDGLLFLILKVLLMSPCSKLEYEVMESERISSCS